METSRPSPVHLVLAGSERFRRPPLPDEALMEFDAAAPRAPREGEALLRLLPLLLPVSCADSFFLDAEAAAAAAMGSLGSRLAGSTSFTESWTMDELSTARLRVEAPSAMRLLALLLAAVPGTSKNLSRAHQGCFSTSSIVMRFSGSIVSSRLSSSFTSGVWCAGSGV